MNSGEDSAFPMVSSSSSASHKYEGSVSMSPVVKDVLAHNLLEGWKIAREPYSSLGEVHVGKGREEVNYREKQEKDKHEETDNERTIKRPSWIA